jgi:hypothetical protein
VAEKPRCRTAGSSAGAGASLARLSPVDVILVVSVVVPFVLFEIWFFFYASDPIPKWAF